MDEHTKVRIDVIPSQLSFQRDQMETIVAFFVARDEMNSKIHLADIRFSPITVAAMELSSFLGEQWADSTTALAKQ
jgi:hypothetical protein